MKSIVVFSKKIDQSSDGRPCTPYYLVVYFHGNILFKKGFVKKWFNVTDAALHILGFRFTIGIYENKTIKENQKTFQNRKDNYMNFAIMTIYAVIPILTLIILLVIYSKK